MTNRLSLLLCDHAQVADGKVFISGGGWSITGPEPTPFGIAGMLYMPADQRGTTHEVRIRLFYRDGSPVFVDSASDQQVEVAASFTIGPAMDALVASEEIGIPIGVVLGPQPLAPGRSYEWRFYLDGETAADWYLPFVTRPSLADATTGD